MLKKAQRLHARTRLKESTVHQTPYFTIRIAQNGTQTSRFGFVISKKVDKSAVVRNRIRRVLATSIQELGDELPKGRDVLFFLKAGSRDATKEAVKTMIARTIT